MKVSNCSGRWKIRRGLSTIRLSKSSIVRRPSRTAPSRSGNAVSKPGKPGRRILAVLLGRRVRRVIGGEAIDHRQVFPQRLLVGLGGESGTDLAAPRSEARNILLGEEQMVRGHLAGDRQPLFLGALIRRISFSRLTCAICTLRPSRATSWMAKAMLLVPRRARRSAFERASSSYGRQSPFGFPAASGPKV